MCDLLHLVWHLNLAFSVFDRGDGFSLAQCINRKCFLGEQLLKRDIPEFEFLVAILAQTETYLICLLKKKVKNKVLIWCLANLNNMQMTNSETQKMVDELGGKWGCSGLRRKEQAWLQMAPTWILLALISK